MVLALQNNLILRSAPLEYLGVNSVRVSKDGQQRDWFSPFETRRFAPLLRVRFVCTASS
jgi:hypothetical protein